MVIKIANLENFSMISWQLGDKFTKYEDHSIIQHYSTMLPEQQNLLLAFRIRFLFRLLAAVKIRYKELCVAPEVILT